MKIKKHINAKLAVILFAVVMLISSLGNVLLSPTASALPEGPPNSKPNKSNPVASPTSAVNYLQVLGNNCQNIDSYGKMAGGGKTCEEIQSVLNANLGCSDNMFYEHEFHSNADKSVVTGTTWFINEGYFKECYNNALAVYNSIADANKGTCNSLSTNSTNYNTCTQRAAELYAALGCGNPDYVGLYTMFYQPKGANDNWVRKPAAFSDCKSRIDAVGKLHIIKFSSGDNYGPDKNPINSSTVKASTGGGNGGGGGSSPGTANQKLTCDTQISNPLTWVLCPVVTVLVGIVEGIDRLITDQLNIKTDTIFCDNTIDCQAYYQAWQSFRNVALGLMALAVLVVVIAQAVGLEILDAYTIRKVLPRLLVAALGITLSWALMKFLIQLSDDLGYGIRHLIYFPFAKLNTGLNLNFSHGITNSLFGGGALATGAVVAADAWLVYGGIGAMLAYAGTAALAVFVAILVLMLRQIAIIMLMFLAPLAMVAYIMPNTQRFYKMWWDTFSRALLMFPLIAAFIATGRVFSAIAINTPNPHLPGVNQLIGFIAYFAPYFMIPLTFRFAGSAVGALGNFVNSKAAGGFNMLSGYRDRQRKSRLERVRGRGLYRKNSGLTKGLNKLGHYTWDLDEQAVYDAGTGTGMGRLTGRLGKRMAGRMAAEQAALKAGQFAEHTAKGVERANMHYTGAWAALGMRGKFRDGLTKEGRKYMDAEYGLKDKHGNLITDENGESIGWRPLENGDYHGLTKFANDLSSAGVTGSNAKYGAQQLLDHAGTLTSFGSHMDTQRASITSVSAAIAAREGKLDGEQMSQIYNASVADAHGDPAGEAFAAAQLAQMERAASSNRQDLRPGKGIRIAQDGEAYSVFSDKIVGTYVDKKGKTKALRAYKSNEALENVKSMKGTAASNAKAETIRAMEKTMLSIVNRERPDVVSDSDANDMLQTIKYNATNPYADVDQRVAWRNILEKTGAQISEQDIGKSVSQARREQMGRNQQTPQAPDMGAGPGMPGGPGVPPPPGVPGPGG